MTTIPTSALREQGICYKTSEFYIVKDCNKLIRVKLLLNNIIVQHEHIEVHSYNVMFNNQTKLLPADTIFYDSIEMFKENIQSKNKISIKYILDKAGVIYISGWYHNGSLAVEYNLYKEVKSFSIDDGIKKINGFIPAKIYPSEKDVYLFNSLNLQKEDGSIESIKGILECMLLNSQQRKLVDEFECLLKKMHESKIKIIGIESELYAYNNCDNIEISYQGYYGIAVPTYDLHKIKSDCYIGAYNEGICVFLKQ